MHAAEMRSYRYLSKELPAQRTSRGLRSKELTPTGDALRRYCCKNPTVSAQPAGRISKSGRSATASVIGSSPTISPSAWTGSGRFPATLACRARPVANPARPDRRGGAGHNQRGKRLGSVWQPNLAREDIGTAERQHAKRDRTASEAVHDGADGAVAARRDDRVETGLRLTRQAFDLAR